MVSRGGKLVTLGGTVVPFDAAAAGTLITPSANVASPAIRAMRNRFMGPPIRNSRDRSEGAALPQAAGRRLAPGFQPMHQTSSRPNWLDWKLAPAYEPPRATRSPRGLNVAERSRIHGECDVVAGDLALATRSGSNGRLAQADRGPRVWEFAVS